MRILQTHIRHRRFWSITLVMLLGLTGGGVLWASPRVHATTITATIFTDPVPGSCSTTGIGDCSLREAVMYANAHANTTIQLLAGTYLLTIGPAGWDDVSTGDLNITGSMTITGAGADQTTIDASTMAPGRDDIFSLRGQTDVERLYWFGPAVAISGVTLTGGSSGAINASLATVSLSESIVEGNSSIGIGCSECSLDHVIVRNNSGSGISLYGTAGLHGAPAGLALTRSIVSNNSGSGVVITPSSTFTATIADTTISNNAVVGVDTNATPCGLCDSQPSTKIMGSTISGSASPSDATGSVGIRTTGTLSVTNSTISGFQGPDEIGIKILNTTQSMRTQSILTNVTLAANRYGLLVGPAGNGLSTIILDSTILASDGLNCVANSGGGYMPAPASAISNDYNLSSDASCTALTMPHDHTMTDPGLDDLGDNGGPTQTHALLPNSRAIDAGRHSNTGCGGVDQRGVTRPVGSACDIGAYEVDVVNPVPLPHASAPMQGGVATAPMLHAPGPMPGGRPPTAPSPHAMSLATALPTAKGGRTPTMTPAPQPAPQPVRH